MNAAVSITELLQAVGSENIRFQNLSTAMENINLKKGVTIVSFATDAISPTDVVMGGGPCGIVVWVDQDLLRTRLDELKQGKCVTYEELRRQHDELLAALKHLYHNARASGAEMGLALDVAKEALAHAEGGEA